MADRWPQGYRAAVVVTVNVDGERALLRADPGLAGHDKTLSTARYGLRRGLPALAEVFAAYGIRPGWMVPAALLRAAPHVVEHLGVGDVGLRGDDLEPLEGVPADERRRLLDEAVRTLVAAGVRPTGYRLPRGDWPEGLADDLADRGIIWSSSWITGDLPFVLPGTRGRSLVEIPYHHVADDRQAFEWNYAPAVPAGHPRIADYDAVIENWEWELDGAVGEGGLWTLVLSPHTIATPARLGLLSGFLQRLSAVPGLWLPSPLELARWWHSSAQPVPAGQRTNMFLAGSGWSGF